MLGAFAAFAMLSVLFTVRERRASAPMLPLSLFTNRMFALTSLVGLLVNIAFYGLIFVFSLYFQRANHWSPFLTGLAFVPMMGVVLPVNLLAPRAGRTLRRANGHCRGFADCGRRVPEIPGYRSRHDLFGRSAGSSWRWAQGWAFWCRP